MFDSHRIKRLNDHGYKSGNILYWTEWALRTRWNCGLEYAREYALEKNVSLFPLITVDADYAHENIRQLVFLIESISTLQAEYAKNDSFLNVIYGKTRDIIQKIIEEHNIGMIVASATYVRYFSGILKSLSIELTLPVIQIDDASLLPPWIASDHEEYAAYTLRKKYWETLSHLSLEKESPWKKCHTIGLYDESKKILESSWYKKYESTLENHEIVQGGEIAAQKHWEYFKTHTLEHYDESRNNPNITGTSFLSPYLHFGCISPLQIYYEWRHLETKNSKLKTSLDAYLEETLIRRELAINMWYYNDDADNWKCLPNWVIKTLDEDREKQTSLIQTDDYTRKELEWGKTHDPLWNAAQNQLIRTGKIHGYVRMYWWKQLTKWFRDWRDAYTLWVYLNDKFALDGCSPNGYTGVAWCFGKHDRPFPPKKTHYGLIRSMTIWGMKKKFDVEKYINHWG